MENEYHDYESMNQRFTEAESEYLSEHNLGRVATSAPGGQPHVVPVLYEFDGRCIYFGGWNLARSLKYRNITQNPRVAFVVDDLAPGRLWGPRGIEIRGVAEVLCEHSAKCVRITPDTKRSWGLEA